MANGNRQPIALPDHVAQQQQQAMMQQAALAQVSLMIFVGLAVEDYKFCRDDLRARQHAWDQTYGVGSSVTNPKRPDTLEMNAPQLKLLAQRLAAHFLEE